MPSPYSSLLQSKAVAFQKQASVAMPGYTVGKFLVDLRKELGLGISELAKEMDADPKVLQFAESNQTFPFDENGIGAATKLLQYTQLGPEGLLHMVTQAVNQSPFSRQTKQAVPQLFVLGVVRSSDKSRRY